MATIFKVWSQIKGFLIWLHTLKMTARSKPLSCRMILNNLLCNTWWAAWFHQSMHIYLKKNHATFHPDPIWNDGTLDFWKSIAPTGRRRTTRKRVAILDQFLIHQSCVLTALTRMQPSCPGWQNRLINYNFKQHAVVLAFVSVTNNWWNGRRWSRNSYRVSRYLLTDKSTVTNSFQPLTGSLILYL